MNTAMNTAMTLITIHQHPDDENHKRLLKFLMNNNIEFYSEPLSEIGSFVIEKELKLKATQVESGLSIQELQDIRFNQLEAVNSHTGLHGTLNEWWYNKMREIIDELIYYKQQQEVKQ